MGRFERPGGRQRGGHPPAAAGANLNVAGGRQDRSARRSATAACPMITRLVAAQTRQRALELSFLPAGLAAPGLPAA